MHGRHSGFTAARVGSMAIAAVILGVQYSAGPGGLTAHWAFARPVYDNGAWWQLFSGQWVHLGWLHATVNSLGFAVLLDAFSRRVDGRLQALAVLGGCAGVALVIALDPQCAHYAGASGAVHGLLAGGALAMLLGEQQPASGRLPMWLLGGLALAALALKLVWQHPATGVSAVPGWLGFATYYPAHEGGAAGAVLAVLLARLGGLPWFGQVSAGKEQ